MPCPFPGMDPYLEGSPYWQGFHNSLMTYARDVLQPVLPRHYIATLEVRIYIDQGGNGTPVHHRVPDVHVIRTRPAASAVKEHATGELGLVGGYWVEYADLEQREAFVNIRAAADQRVITSIELLSPANKRGGEGERQYRKKQEEAIQGGLNLVEVDLLRGGHHVLAVPPRLLMDLPDYDFLVSIYRAERSYGYHVYPWTLRNTLPTVTVPLAPGDPEIELDLQKLYETAFENGAFDRLLQYHQRPTPMLHPDDAEWANELLRAAGMLGDSDAGTL